MPHDYSNWRELTRYDPPADQFVLIGMEGSYPVVGKRCRYVKSRPIYWLPIEGGMKCEE